MVGTTGLNQYSLGAALPPSGLRATRSLVIAPQSLNLWYARLRLSNEQTSHFQR
ncbi:MAG: hypothetical protein P8O99_02435 [Pseudomonadales bacterium]|nr:hypothetical protein [Pseudomonadales bacterium]